MICWTIQHTAALDRFQRTGRLRADGRRVWPEFRPAYRWLASQLTDRVGPPPAGVRYPVWVWAKRPDLRCAGHLAPGTAGALLLLEVPAERVLLTDFDRWHAVLGHRYLSLHEDEPEAADEAGIRASWARVFDLAGPRDKAWEGPRVVQGCLWEVWQKEMRQVRRFVAR